MGTSTHLKEIIVCMALFLCSLVSTAQVRISGTVYDKTARYGMSGVTVMSTSGAGTVADSAGRYSIRLHPEDSLSFSYQGKATMKFAVKEINPYRPFNMSIRVTVHELPTVNVSAKPLNYHLDSLENRNEYREVFDYAPEYLTSGNGGAGVSLDALFSLRKIKRMENFRRYLEQEERDKYVEHRFNKALVTKITGLKSPALDEFMERFRPSYEQLLSFENEYEYYKYIRDCGRFFSGRWRTRNGK